MITDTLLLLAALAVFALVSLPQVRRARLWRATVTPLASIIGSGFLIVAPLLQYIVAGWAVLAMIAISLLALGIGGVLRFNIRHIEPLVEDESPPRSLLTIERLSDLALGFAYVVSVAFYLRLLAAFALDAFAVHGEMAADAVASVLLMSLAAVAWRGGLTGLERLEAHAVNAMLGIIVALLGGLLVYDLNWIVAADSRAIALTPPDDWVHTLRLLGGILLIVQGFETSRYLGEEYDAATRVRSMRLSQILSAIVYVLFVALALPIMIGIDEAPSETAIVDLVSQISVVLPLMLIATAAMSQLSSGVADTLGAGGLLEEVSRQRIGERTAHLLTVGAALALVWLTEIFEIITIASRAFAAYYALQCLAALVTVPHTGLGPVRCRLYRAGFALLFVVLLGILLFAIPASHTG